jgi:hypothetical protein
MKDSGKIYPENGGGEINQSFSCDEGGTIFDMKNRVSMENLLSGWISGERCISFKPSCVMCAQALQLFSHEKIDNGEVPDSFECAGLVFIHAEKNFRPCVVDAA